MKLKRVLAKDTRTALAMIKASLGDDAVILSNNKIAGEVEIVAAIDFDENREKAKANSNSNSKSGSLFSDRLSASLNLIKADGNRANRPIEPLMRLLRRINLMTLAAHENKLLLLGQ